MKRSRFTTRHAMILLLGLALIFAAMMRLMLFGILRVAD
jgi:hypothetical protein